MTEGRLRCPHCGARTDAVHSDAHALCPFCIGMAKCADLGELRPYMDEAAKNDALASARNELNTDFCNVWRRRCMLCQDKSLTLPLRKGE